LLSYVVQQHKRLLSFPQPLTKAGEKRETFFPKVFLHQQKNLFLSQGFLSLERKAC